MSYVNDINALVVKLGFTAVPQRPIRSGYENLALLSLTDQRTRKSHPGVRITARADRQPRGHRERDVYRMLQLAEYADEVSEQGLVVMAAHLQPSVAVSVVTVGEALDEAIREIEKRLEDRGRQTDLTWWRQEHQQWLGSA